MNMEEEVDDDEYVDWNNPQDSMEDGNDSIFGKTSVVVAKWHKSNSSGIPEDFDSALQFPISNDWGRSNGSIVSQSMILLLVNGMERS